MRKVVIFLLSIAILSISGCSSHTTSITSKTATAPEGTKLETSKTESTSTGISPAESSPSVATPFGNTPSSSGNNGENSSIQSSSSDVSPALRTETIEPPIVLYNGLTLDIDDYHTDVIEGKNTTLNQKLYTKYEQKYYLYHDGKLLGTAQGKIEPVGLYAYWDVGFLNFDGYAEVAISQDYNPYTRDITYIYSDFPSEFDPYGNVMNRVNNLFKVNAKIKELCIVDLNGDGQKEYIALVADETNSFWAKCFITPDFYVYCFTTSLLTQIHLQKL